MSGLANPPYVIVYSAVNISLAPTISPESCEPGLHGPSPCDTSQGPANIQEFVVFVCWYVFLVLCCIAPTIYAFRRRRQVGRQEEIFELSLQESLRQAQLLSVGQGEHVALQGDNVVIVRDGQPISIMRSSLQDQRTMEFFENRTQERRNKLIEILLPTTMTVLESDLLRKDNIECLSSKEGKEIPPQQALNGSTLSLSSSSSEKESPEKDMVNSSNDSSTPASNYGLNFNHCLDEEEEGAFKALTLRSTSEKIVKCEDTLSEDVSQDDRKKDSEIMREVPILCIICLCMYEVGSEVTWAYASSQKCTHAFHKDCIMNWILTKEEALCPCCRDEFIPEPIMREKGLLESDANDTAFDILRRIFSSS